MPEKALTRAIARHNLTMLNQRGANAAKRSKRYFGLDGAERGPNVELIQDIRTLRARHRALTRDNAWAAKAKRLIVNKVVGTGVTATWSGPRAVQLQAAWNDAAKSTFIDYSGARNFYALQRLWFDTAVNSGACFVAKVITPQGLRLATYEPDQLDSRKDTMTLRGGKPGPRTVHGMEFGANGELVAAWFRVDPDDDSSRSTRILAKDFLILQETDRPGQVLGVPWGSRSILRLHDLGGYEDAHLKRNEIANLFMGFFHSSSADKASEISERMSPGALDRLDATEEITFANPPDPTPMGPYVQHHLRAVAADYGISYESLSGDYSQSNFSSVRMGAILETQNIEVWRWQLLMPQLLDPIAQWWLDLQVGAGAVEWSPEYIPMTDPVREIPMMVNSIRAGIETMPELLRQRGRDPDRHLAELSAWNAKVDSAKVVLDSDPRKTSSAGQLQAVTNEVKI